MSVQAYADEYFELLEAFPQELQRTATRLKEIDAASHRLLADVTKQADALTGSLLALAPADRDARLARLRDQYASLLGFMDEKAATIGRAVAQATVTTTRLQDTLEKLEGQLGDATTTEVDDGGQAGAYYASSGNGVYRQGMSSSSASGAPKQRSPGKPPGPGEGRVSGATAAGAGALAALAGTAAGAMAAPSGKGGSSGGSGGAGQGGHPWAAHSGAGSGSGGGSGGGGGGTGAGSSGSLGGQAGGAGSGVGGKRKGQAPEPAAPPGNGISPPKKKQRYNPLASLEGLPIYKGKNPCPPLCGPNPAAPDYIMQKGDTVAARTSKPKDAQQEWILATVVRFYAGRQRYEVEDVEEEEGDGKQPGTRKKYTLSADAIIPMPKSLPDPSKMLEFPAKSTVLALYPGTTCFYEAEVVLPPSKRRKENDYLLQFVDDEESGTPQKAVPQAFVLNMPSNGGGAGM